MLTAAPGEAVYTELESTLAWTLTLDAPVRAGAYMVEAGDYPLQAVALNGFLFEPGDGCQGDPSTQAGRLAAEPAAIFVPENADRLCVINIFDVRRCANAKPVMGHAPDEAAAPTRHTLVYEGLEPADPDMAEPGTVSKPGPGAGMEADADPALHRPLARFELLTERGELMDREALVSPAPGLLQVGAGRFKLVSADETGVVMQFERPISRAGLAEPPRFREPPEDDTETGADGDPVKIRTAPDSPDPEMRDAVLAVGPR